MCYKTQESYLHYYSKQILINWLKKKSNLIGIGNYIEFGPMIWKIEDDPDSGIYEEFAMDETNGFVNHWQGLEGFSDPMSQGRASPSLEALGEAGINPPWICDIAIFHNGRIRYALEVIKKNVLTEEKIMFYNKYGILFWEIPCDWIMMQIHGNPIPEKFAFHRTNDRINPKTCFDWILR